VDAFSGNNSTVAFTLSGDPGSENNTQVYVSGVYQEKDTYSVSGTTLTFSTAPPTGTSNIEVVWTAPIAIGTPSDGTVTTAKIADANVTPAKIAGSTDFTFNGLTVGKGGGAVATNTAVGASALNANTTGANNTALGYQAGITNTTGGFITAVGSGALQSNTTVSYNTAVGHRASFSNTTGGGNLALGAFALTGNTTGEGNTAVGNWFGGVLESALYANTTGNNNVAVGVGSLKSNTTAANNTGVGYASLSGNTTGASNTAIGNSALQANTTASNNTAVGFEAGYNNTGAGNTFFGYRAGKTVTSGTENILIGDGVGSFSVNLTTGSNNIYMGNATFPSASGVSNEIAIQGSVGQGKGANTAFLGGSSGAYNGANSATWSVTSDQRLKKNIVDNNDGLDKINSIRVRNFEYRLPEEITELETSTAVKKEGVQLGVIAQELQAVCSDCVKEESTGVLSVDASNLTWHMINAIKELKALNDTLTARVTALEGN